MAIYMWRETTPITTAGIYRNQTDGLISLSSDGSTRYTIADKNLGATIVWNSGDTLSEANCGKYYQRGNNYGFPFTGSVSTSSTQVNAQNYGPGNYYNSSIFITLSSNTWDSSNNQNLRGGTTGTNEAMKGPCDTGFHIPTDTETTALKTAFEGLGLSGGPSFSQYLKVPFAGHRDSGNSSATNSGTSGSYRTSVYRNSTSSYRIYFTSSSLYPAGSTYTTTGCSIRPFKNDAVQPDESRTKLY